ncbi:MAG: cupin-like domain-containing protein [Myxococcales bacterium]|nr:cupin-like domain-containing protein [Myxococcales bacterium]
MELAQPAPSASLARRLEPLPGPELFERYQAPAVDLKTWLFTRSLLVGRMALVVALMPFFKRRPEQPVDLDNNVKFLFEDFEHRFLDKHLSRLGPVRDEMSPVPRVRPEEVTPQDVQALIKHTPLVIEGLADDGDRLEKWGLESLKQRFGDARLWVTRPDVTEHRLTLAELLDAMIAGDHSGQYARSAADLFHQKPELMEQLPLETMRSYMGDLATFFGAEVFAGGHNTGSPFHCAPFYNFFTLVHGTKEWVLIHPSYSWWLYPNLHHTGYAFSRVRQDETPESIEKNFPLFRRIPKMRCRLQPGDVLINPPWWWHAISNLTPTTIGIATRWAEPARTENNPLFERVSLLSKGARDLHGGARRAKDGNRLTDALWRDRFHLKLPSAGRPSGPRR